MNILLIVILAICWWTWGVFGFIYWYTKEWNLTGSDLVFTLFMGLMGPLNWITGRFIHGKTSKWFYKLRKHIFIHKRQD